MHHALQQQQQQQQRETFTHVRTAACQPYVRVYTSRKKWLARSGLAETETFSKGKGRQTESERVSQATPMCVSKSGKVERGKTYFTSEPSLD